jgi:hypothetical protein
MHFDNPVIESHGGYTREHQAHVLHSAPGGPGGRAYVLRPFPAGLVGGPPDGHSTQAHNLEPAFEHFAHLVGLLEAPEHKVHQVRLIGEDWFHRCLTE